ncbi:hypothetical protein FHL15_003402 [Xylaria flabelliformis]|uniref:Uncharacterized protein n=1 Tax=Xylaria flabelliformis TaxID=2512241 RepID=A0A553I6L5_9PEZI|nr:hypothetical protein FHL15_003402 [Xylaria flabelliformis]
MDSHGFARPPPDFDPEQAGAAFRRGHGQGLLNPADAIEESVEDEIKRKTADLEKAKNKPLTDKEKERVANKIRSLREGGWLEGLKLQLVGKNAVPIEYFNRLVAEHENTIFKVAQINARAARKVAEKDAQIQDLLNKNGEDDSISDDNSTLLNNAILAEEKYALQDDLAKCRQRGAEMQDEIQRLNTQLQQEKSNQDNTDVQSALAKCEYRVSELQIQLDSAKSDLQTARTNSSRHYNDVQMLREQKTMGLRRERGLKDEITQLREENRELKDAVAVQRGASNSEGLQERISGLEVERAKCKGEVERLKRENSKLQAERSNCNSKVESLERENKKLKDAASPQGKPNDSEDLRQQIRKLQAELARRDKTIQALEAELEQARNASSPARDDAAPEEPGAELRARCAELRNARDLYRNKWARQVAGQVKAGSESLIEFWQAVENTDKEMKALYQGIERLGRALGLTNDVLDTPQVLDRIITQITGSVIQEKETLELAVVNLRNVNLLARMQIETLERQIDRVQSNRTEDEVKLELRAVQEEEVERRVSVRTQTYRDHRRSIISHIFDAQAEFLALAETSGDRDAIEALVDRFLRPTSLPMIQVARVARQ